MNNKILRLNKIDERYILSPKKFLYTFGYMCLGDKLVNSNLNKRQLYFFLEQVLTPVPEEMVTYENVAKGNIILIGRGNNFNAYLRPRDIRKEIEVKPKSDIKRVVVKQEKKKTIKDISLSQLIRLYNENISSEEAEIYLNEILLRSSLSMVDVNKPKDKVLSRAYKSKYQRQKQRNNIDK